MALDSNVIKELLENGVHFGHQTDKWNPKMKRYIFGEKSGIYIIDLKQTEEALSRAVEFLRKTAAEGKTVLFVGTKKQAKEIIRREAKRCGMYFVDERWLGGCLTNFSTIRKSVERLNKLQEMKASEIYKSFAKKEKATIDREEYKLLKNLEGIRGMIRLPDCVVVVDAEAENIAVREAKKAGVPVVALVDTNCDPDLIDYPIPGNDDAIKSISYIVATLANAVVEGRGGEVVIPVPEEKAEEEISEEEPPAEEEKEAAPEEAPEELEELEEPEEEKIAEEEEKDAPGKGFPGKKAKVKRPLKRPKKIFEDEDIVEGDIKLD